METKTEYTPKPYHKMPIGYPVRAERHATSEKECCIVDSHDIWIGDADVSHAETIVRTLNTAPELLEACDPSTLEAIADELSTFEHSARASSLRAIAKRQRAAIQRAGGAS